ncbi:MAG TPA: hypothetical protein VGO62_04875, partial [Myxococcota bacterium]
MSPIPRADSRTVPPPVSTTSTTGTTSTTSTSKPASGTGFSGASTYTAPSKGAPKKNAVDEALAQKETQQRVGNYFNEANAEYTLPDGSQTHALPAFRMNWKDDGGAAQERLTSAIKPTDAAMKTAIHMVAYGRGSPEQVRQVTQALVDKGGVAAVKAKWNRLGEAEFKKTFPTTPWPVSDSNAVKLLQGEMGVGIDCAGFVQQSFLAVHSKTRKEVGFDSVGNENLASLSGNKHFAKVSPKDAQPGD